MTIDLHKVRSLFPITKESIFFNHAATGPMSLPARKAIEECIKVYSRQAEFRFDEYFGRLNTARTLVARLIGADPEEITFTHNTSEGLYVTLINLPLHEGDKILVMDEVFPTVRYIVDYNLPHVEKKYIPFLGRDAIEVVKSNLDESVKVVVVDFVQFLSGEMIDLKSLGMFLKEKEIYLVVDGIQAIGAVDFSVQETEVDFLACGGAKWLFGPSGTGFLYINKKNFGDLKKLHTGWLGADWRSFENFDSYPPLFEDARKFEQGTRNVIGISAFCENIKILLEYGIEQIQGQILGLKNLMRQKFVELNYGIITPGQGPQSGILTVSPTKDPKSIFGRLAENRVVISFRNNCLRFSPHFYNTKEEVEKIVTLLT